MDEQPGQPPPFPPPPSPWTVALIDIGKALILAVVDEIVKPALRDWREQRRLQKGLPPTPPPPEVPRP